MIRVGSKVKLKDNIPGYLTRSDRYRSIQQYEVYEVTGVSSARKPEIILYVKLSVNNYWYEVDSFEDAYNSNLEKILT